MPAGEQEYEKAEEGEDKGGRQGEEKAKTPSSMYKVTYGEGSLSDLQRLGLLGAVVLVVVLYVRQRRHAARQREFDEKVMA